MMVRLRTMSALCALDSAACAVRSGEAVSVCYQRWVKM